MEMLRPTAVPPAGDHGAFTRLGTISLVLGSALSILLLGCSAEGARYAEREVAPDEIVPLPEGQFEGDGELILPAGFRYERILEAVDPTDLRLLPGGETLLITTKRGELLSVPLENSPGQAREPTVLWSMNTHGHPGLHESPYHDLGLMGVAVDPDWPERPFLYVTAAYLDLDPSSAAGRGFLQDADYRELSRSALFRLRLDDAGRVESSARITPEFPSAKFHNIGHMDFAADGNLYVSMGDALRPDEAQDPTSPLGKILRFRNPDSLPPAEEEEPDDAAPEIAVLGVRNGFGLSVTDRGELLVPENGHEGWDELYLLPLSELDAPANLEHPLFEGFRPSEGHRERKGIPEPVWKEALAQLGRNDSVRKPLVAWEVTICPTASVRLRDSHLPETYRGAILQLVGTPSRYGTSGGRPRLGEVVVLREEKKENGEPYRYAENFLHCRGGCGTPTSLRQAPDGSLLLATYLHGGAIYRIRYQEGT